MDTQAAFALERRRMCEVAQRRGREMELLLRLAETTASAANLDELYERVLQGVIELAGADRAAILVCDTRGAMRFVASRGLSETFRRAVAGFSLWGHDGEEPRPVLVGDVESDGRIAPYREALIAESIRSVAFVPLVEERRLIGKLMIFGPRPRVYADHDEQLAIMFASCASHGVSRARSVEEERASARRLALIARASRHLVAAGADRTTLLDALVREIGTTLDCSVALTLLTEGGELRPVGFYHPDPAARAVYEAALARSPTRLGQYVVGNVAASGQSLLIRSIDPAEAVRRLNPTFAALFERFPIYSFVCVPLRTRGRILGTLQASRTRANEEFSSEDLMMFEELAERAAGAIANANLIAELEASNRSREEILAVVSHDLRNPLSTILMASSAALGSDAVRDPAIHKRLSIIHRNSEQMARMISDLLDFAGIQSGRLAVQRARFLAEQALQAAIEMFEPIAAARGIELRTSVSGPLPCLDSDRARVIQVLANLLSNAVKVCRSGGAVEVTASVREREVVFCVRDDGPGMPPAELEHLFERYWRGAHTTYQGHGLGLAIAKGIVDVLGGRIWAESTVGTGSRFCFTIPA